MATKPPALRILDRLRVPYELVEFDPAIRSASAIAELKGEEGAAVYKTLVVQREPPDKRPYLVMAPSTKELDLRVLARQLDVKRVRMASHTEAERVTGLQVGGISAIALRDRHWPVYVDRDVLKITTVLVSAGQRGADVRVSVSDLLSVTGAHAIDLTPGATSA